MTRQLELPGMPGPLRPSVGKITIAAQFLGPTITAAAPIDWTTASTEMTPVLDSSLMNVRSEGTTMSISGDTVVLLPGQYRIEYHPHVQLPASGEFALAVTNGDGSTVYAEGFDLYHLNAIVGMVPIVTALVHITETDPTSVGAQVSFRVCGRTTGDVPRVEPTEIALITRIGNVNET